MLPSEPMGKREKGRERGLQPAAPGLGSPAERHRSFLRRTTVGAEGSEHGLQEAHAGGQSFLAPLGR